MRFAFVRHIAYKELLSTLRDRRALISNLLLPLLILPVVMLGLPLLLGGLFQREGEAVSQLAVSGLEHLPAELITLIKAQNAELIEVADPLVAVRDGDFQAGFSVDATFTPSLEAGDKAALALYSKRNNMRSELIANKIASGVQAYQQGLVAERLKAAGLDPEILEPIAITPVDATTEAERAGGMMGWLIPFFLAIWILTGGQMTAVDATAGEKERGTLEVLLVTPVRRIEVVAGKAIATMTTGLTAGIMAIAGYLGGGLILRSFLAQDPEMAQVGEVILGSLSVTALTIMLLVVSAVLLSALIANLLMGITMFAKSFKEAQSYLAPISFLLILPLVALQFADFFDFSALVYLIPIVNIMLSMDAIIKGNLQVLQLFLTWASTLGYAALLLAFAYRNFRREDVLFRA
jgi:sodium transport system permease protein